MDFGKLTNFLDSLEGKGIPGCDMSVWKDGREIYRHMAGYADKENGRAMAGDEMYNMYSMSKVVTCAAALTLFEKGAFLLDDPIAEYIPEFGSMQVEVTKPTGEKCLEPLRTPITFRHLFTMTSGLDYNVSTPAIRSMIDDTNGRAPTVEAVKALTKAPLHFQPGTEFLYSLSHDVLAALVEVISGKTFGQYVKETIFDPCGMVDSAYIFPEEKCSRFAMQYTVDGKGNVVPMGLGNCDVIGTEYESGGAGMVSTVDDYMRFGRMMTNLGITDSGSRVLASRTVDMMRQDQLTPMGVKSFTWPHFLGYSYGLGVRTMASRAIGGSPGPVGEFGWGGLAGSYVLLDPENNLTAVYAQHIIPSQEPYIHRRLRNILYSCLD